MRREAVSGVRVTGLGMRAGTSSFPAGVKVSPPAAGFAPMPGWSRPHGAASASVRAGADQGSELSCSLHQYLKTLGIKVKHLKHHRERRSSSGLVFGNSLHVLPQYSLPDGSASIPRFLMEACTFLSQHVHTEGLFRKSGSAIRMKSLRAKLQQGVCSLELSSVSDVAGLLKQFFRELPEPVVPAALHGPLCQAQRLWAEEERSAVTILLTCLMPSASVGTLRYLLSFLQTVAARSTENKMGIQNLAVVFTPNLFQLPAERGGPAGRMREDLPLLTLTTETLIARAQSIGHLPPCVLDRLPAPVGLDVGSVVAPSDAADQSVPVKRRKRLRRSVGVFVSGALSRLKMSITPQADKPTVCRQQEASPGADTTLADKRKSAANSIIATKKSRSASVSAEPDPRTHGAGPRQADFTPADCSQDEDWFSENSRSPSVFQNLVMEGDILSTGGGKAPSTLSVRTRSSKAASPWKRRVLFRKQSVPRTLGYRPRVRKSPQSLGQARNKDSMELGLNTEMMEPCCERMAQSLGHGSEWSPLPGTSVHLTAVPQGIEPPDNDFPSPGEEDDSGLLLSRCLDFKAVPGAEMRPAFLPCTPGPDADPPGLAADPPGPTIEAKNPPRSPSKTPTPGSARGAAPEIALGFQGWDEAAKLDFSPPGALPLQSGPIRSHRALRRWVSMPEDVAQSWWQRGEGDEFGANFGLDLEAMGDISPMAQTENWQTFHGGSTVRVEPCTAPPCRPTPHPHGRTTDSHSSRETVAPLERGLLDFRVTSSSHGAGGGMDSAQSCRPGPSDTPSRSHPQTSLVEMARSYMTDRILKLNKLSAKRGSLKHGLPVVSKPTPRRRSVRRLAQQATTLFWRKTERLRPQDARRSLSLESALEMGKDQAETKWDYTGGHGAIDMSQSYTHHHSGCSEPGHMVSALTRPEIDTPAKTKAGPSLNDGKKPNSPETSPV